MRKRFAVVTLSLFAVSAFAGSNGDSGVTANNTSVGETAVGSDAVIGIATNRRETVVDVFAGVEAAGSILVDPSLDCGGCEDNIRLVDNPRRSTAVGNAAAGSIVVR